MKTVLLITFFCFFTFSGYGKTKIATKSGRTGVGFAVGQPMGLSFNYFLKKKQSLDGILAYKSSDNYDKLTIASALIFHLPAYYVLDDVSMNFYYGIGGEVSHKDHDDNSKDETLFGPRVSAGSGHWFETIPLELNLESALIFSIFEETEVDFEIFVLGRIYF